jgi:hypothetical protein
MKIEKETKTSIEISKETGGIFKGYRSVVSKIEKLDKKIFTIESKYGGTIVVSEKELDDINAIENLRKME